MKKQVRKGSMAIESALLMPVILLVIMTVLYLFFYVHNRAWLTAAAYEAALSGSMEAAVPDGNSREAALKKGVKVTGATVHFVNEIPDGGEIIMQKAVKVRDGDTPETLQKRVMRLAEWKILPAAAEKISDEIVRKKAEEK